MIHYDRGCGLGGFSYFARVFTITGSIVPKAMMIAVPNALFTMFLRYLVQSEQELFGNFEVFNNSSIWSGFNYLVGFLIVFRTSQGYNRFWEGCTNTQAMRSNWYTSCSSLCAYTKCSSAAKDAIGEFKHTLVRLVSMMHALALAEMEDTSKVDMRDVHAYNIEVIDASGLDDHSLQTLRDSDQKVELLYQWVQALLVENIGTGVLSVPPPILSRSFQELGVGMVAFHQAMKIACVPFPFPYAQVCDILLMAHFCLVPIVVVQWVDSLLWSGVFSFVQVLIFWALNLIAVEIENPFGLDENDLDWTAMQNSMNSMLLVLLDEETDHVPRLSRKALMRSKSVHNDVERALLTSMATIRQAWDTFSLDIEPHRSAWVTTQAQLFTKSRKGKALIEQQSQLRSELREALREKRRQEAEARAKAGPEQVGEEPGGRATDGDSLPGVPPGATLENVCESLAAEGPAISSPSATPHLFNGVVMGPAIGTVEAIIKEAESGSREQEDLAQDPRHSPARGSTPRGPSRRLQKDLLV